MGQRADRNYTRIITSKRKQHLESRNGIQMIYTIYISRKRQSYINGRGKRRRKKKKYILNGKVRMRELTTIRMVLLM